MDNMYYWLLINCVWAITIIAIVYVLHVNNLKNDELEIRKNLMISKQRYDFDLRMCENDRAGKKCK
jgi:hypothetical protein